MSEREKMTEKCHTTTCKSPPTTRVFWAGFPKPMCTPCAERAKRIGEAMGCPVYTEPLSATEGAEHG